MALADPQVLTIATVAQSLPNVSRDGTSSVYSKDDGTVTLKVTHSNGKIRKRHQSRMDHNKIAADPLLAGVNRQASMSGIYTLDVPNVGYSVTEIRDNVKAHLAWFTTASDAALIKWIGGES